MVKMFTIGYIIVLIALTVAEREGADRKWVWEKNSRSNTLQRDEDGPKASARYEIFEPEGGDFDYNRPQRPRPDYNRPDYNRPPYPQPNIDPGFGGGRPPIKQFDTCSCTEKFNCQSPGLSYGHCDVGKSYCCFNKHGGVELGPAPSRPIQSPANGVLVGPTNGGDFGYGRPDFDRPDRYDRPNYGRPAYASRPGYGGGGRPQGVLVGPGGPTGIIGRPGLGLGASPGYGGGGRPQGVLVGPGGPTGVIGRPGLGLGGRPGNGVLVGPGGPYDRPYGGGYDRPFGVYGRSVQDEKDKKSSST